MSRRSNLDALFGAKPAPKPAAGPDSFADANPEEKAAEFAPANPPAPQPERRRSGAIGAMSNTLRGLAAKAEPPRCSNRARRSSTSIRA